MLKGLTFCWIKTADIEDEKLEELRSEMREAVKMLRYAVGKKVDFDKDCEMLTQADPRVAPLLDA